MEYLTQQYIDATIPGTITVEKVIDAIDKIRQTMRGDEREMYYCLKSKLFFHGIAQKGTFKQIRRAVPGITNVSYNKHIRGWVDSITLMYEHSTDTLRIILGDYSKKDYWLEYQTIMPREEAIVKIWNVIIECE